VDESILLGDFLLQSGNSGGPLMNIEGEVLGVNTFGEGSISGAVRIEALRVFLSSPELLAQSVDVEPAPNQLRSVSAVRYPVVALNHKAQTEPLDLTAYQFGAGDFKVTAITPVLIAKVQVAHEKRRSSNQQQKRGSGAEPKQDDQEPYYEWHRSTETGLDYAVTFDVRPESSSKRNVMTRIVPPMFLFGKSGKADREFKGEFLELRIYRDGELIDPIMPGRQILETGDDKTRRGVDQTYGGNYVYSPDEFMTGNTFRMQIIDARDPNAVHRELIFTAESKLIKQLRSDFSFSPGVLITQAP
jgi:hypothetical protein